MLFALTFISVTQNHFTHNHVCVGSLSYTLKANLSPLVSEISKTSCWERPVSVYWLQRFQNKVTCPSKLNNKAQNSITYMLNVVW